MAGENWHVGGACDEGGEVQTGDGDDQEYVDQGEEADEESPQANGGWSVQWAAVEVDWKLHRNDWYSVGRKLVVVWWMKGKVEGLVKVAVFKGKKRAFVGYSKGGWRRRINLYMPGEDYGNGVPIWLDVVERSRNDIID